ncbi:hypothetical protein FIE12Z_1183 [Fusarium flagelliforme]|uniref:Uncharacterized protein n=1 Tax=Fusarium flagelliforme TaxID=2675880 RepID=A0A395N323_9HYPO|nr:hypothetical protein FIE12Z_1183 [Fusarium flagelliforme]
MDEAFIAQSSERVIPIQQLIQTWPARNPPGKSPDETFQDEHHQAKIDLDAAYEKYKSQGTQDSFKEFKRSMNRLEALEQPDEATREAKQSEYQQSELNRQLSLVNGLLDIFGDVAAVNAIFNNWCKRADKQPSSSSDAAESQSRTNASPGDNCAETQGSQNPTIETASNNPHAHRSGEPSNNHHDEPTEVEPTHPRIVSKKRKNTSVSPESQSVKRSWHVRSEAGPAETIEYCDVYQDGKAVDKYNIIEHDGLHYVLRCTKHGLIFSGDRPLQGAMNHLRSPGHPNETISHSLAIARLGVLVLNCDEDKKIRNNEAVNKHVKHMRDQRRRRHRASQAYRDLNHDPEHGDMYMAWWDLGKQRRKTAKTSEEENLKLFAFLVLPFFPQENDRFGVSVTTSNLNNDIPTCYKYNKSTGIFDWAQDYMPGGKKALKRLYPIMCFDGGHVPSVQWIPITHFRRFNAKDRDLENKNIVNDYIASQKRIMHQPDFDLEADGDLDDSSSSDDSSSDSNFDSDSDSDRSDDDHLPIAFRYTQTVDGNKYEIIYLDDDGTCRKVMEDPENYPSRWSTPEVEVKKEPGSQDRLEQVDRGAL